MSPFSSQLMMRKYYTFNLTLYEYLCWKSPDTLSNCPVISSIHIKYCMLTFKSIDRNESKPCHELVPYFSYQIYLLCDMKWLDTIQEGCRSCCFCQKSLSNPLCTFFINSLDVSGEKGSKTLFPFCKLYSCTSKSHESIGYVLLINVQLALDSSFMNIVREEF